MPHSNLLSKWTEKRKQKIELYQLLQPIGTKSVDIVWHCPSSLRCSLWQLKVRLFENDYVAIVWDVMFNLWLSNVPPSSPTILLSKLHPQLKVESHTLMNPVKEVKPVWKIQCSMDPRVLAGILPTEKKQVTMDAATACSLGFALIGAWLLGYRPGFFFCVRFSISRETCRIRFWDHWNSWLCVGIVWKQPQYKSKTYHITILHHRFDEWRANYSKFNEIDFIDDAWGRLYWWMGFPTAKHCFMEIFHCYVHSG